MCLQFDVKVWRNKLMMMMLSTEDTRDAHTVHTARDRPRLELPHLQRANQEDDGSSPHLALCCLYFIHKGQMSK